MNNEMESIQLPGPGNFQFSRIRPDLLEETEYTLVTLVTDITGSVENFSDELLKMKKEIIKSCNKHPRKENLLIRDILFNSRVGVKEVHGFKPLSMIDPDNDYKSLDCDSLTNLFDATYTSIEATLLEAKNLIDQDYGCNGAIFIITDGEDNESSYTKNQIKNLIESSSKAENIESLISVLIGVNSIGCKSFLEEFKNDSGLTQYIDIGDVTPNKLAKLAKFISESISSQSQALGSGSASQPLTF